MTSGVKLSVYNRQAAGHDMHGVWITMPCNLHSVIVMINGMLHSSYCSFQNVFAPEFGHF